MSLCGAKESGSRESSEEAAAEFKVEGAGGRGAGERWVNLRKILERESPMLADELNMDILIIFVIKITHTLYFNAFLNQVLYIISPVWALGPKAFCTQFSFPKQRLQLPKCPRWSCTSFSSARSTRPPQ